MREQFKTKFIILWNSNFSELQFSKIKIGWLGDIQGQYLFEEGILELCEKALQALEQHKLQVDLIKIDMKTNIVWDSWTTLRASILYQDIIDMKLENIGEMHPGIVWEHHKGQNITDDDISNALNQRNVGMHEIDNLFNKSKFFIKIDIFSITY